MMYGMARLSGVLFVASVPRYNVGREKASFPYTFANFMRNTSGPLVGYLGHKFGVRAVTTFGAILGSIGIGLCYFAESIDIVTLLWGAVFGLGFGLGNILLPVSINQYFDKHRATASGISFSGACLGSFILPPIVEILLDTFGLSGTFLFLSGFVLNCIPAALLLKKPNFEIQTPNPYDEEQSEKQSIVSGTKVKLYSVENEARNSHPTRKRSTLVSTSPGAEAKEESKYSALTYEERMKRLSTQTLLSDYSIRMSNSEPLDVDQIIQNSKGRRQVDPTVLEAEILSLSSHNTDQDGSSEKDEVFEKDTRSSSVQLEKPIMSFKQTRALSAENVFTGNEKSYLERNGTEAYQNYGYQEDSVDVIYPNKFPTFVPNSNTLNDTDSRSLSNKEIYFGSYQRSSDNFKNLSEQFKNPSRNQTQYDKSFDWSDTDKQQNGIMYDKNLPESEKTSSLGSFSVIFDPMFILIAITNAIYCFTFVCMITIIVDFARDLRIGISNEKYVLMLLSIGDITGRLGLGWVTDRGHMSTAAFASLCFACQGLFTAAIVWSKGFVSLVILVTLYGLSEAGLIVIFPIIIAQYIDHDKQTVAIPSSNFLSGPLCLAVAPLIGYFRDDVGAYDWIFYGIAILSAVCSLSWMFAPCIARCQKRRKSTS